MDLPTMNPDNPPTPDTGRFGSTERTSLLFETTMEVRITDLNYGNHVGNDVFLRFAQEARVRWLTQWGLSEKDIGGIGLILTEAHLLFKAQAFYGDLLKISMHCENISHASFDLVYRMTRDSQAIVTMHTKMAGFDYTQQKVRAFPEAFRHYLKSGKL
jgi:acyl-CoA thioesterase FadM